MGLDIVSFNVQNFVDGNDVIENLGIDNIVIVFINSDFFQYGILAALGLAHILNYTCLVAVRLFKYCVNPTRPVT